MSTQVSQVLRPGKGYVKTSPGWPSPACAPTDWRRATCRDTSPPTRRRERNGCTASTPPTPGPRYGPRKTIGSALIPPTSAGRRALHHRRLGPRLRRYPAAARHHLHRFRAQRHRGLGRRRPIRGRRVSMRDFICPNCGQHLAFENSVCLSCGSRLGFSLDKMAFLVIASGEGSEHGGAVDAASISCARIYLPNVIGWSRWTRSGSYARRAADPHPAGR